MSLQQWHKNGWLRPYETSRKQVADLFDIVERDLADASTTRLSSDWQFGIAYNAALKLCTILLYAKGYRPDRGAFEGAGWIMSIIGAIMVASLSDPATGKPVLMANASQRKSVFKEVVLHPYDSHVYRKLTVSKDGQGLAEGSRVFTKEMLFRLADGLYRFEEPVAAG